MRKIGNTKEIIKKYNNTYQHAWMILNNKTRVFNIKHSEALNQW